MTGLWSLRRWFWNRWTVFQVPAQHVRPVRCPDPNGGPRPVPFTAKFRSVRSPASWSPITSRRRGQPEEAPVLPASAWLYGVYPDATGPSRPSPADPDQALDQAYTGAPAAAISIRRGDLRSRGRDRPRRLAVASPTPAIWSHWGRAFPLGSLGPGPFRVPPRAPAPAAVVEFVVDPVKDRLDR